MVDLFRAGGIVFWIIFWTLSVDPLSLDDVSYEQPIFGDVQYNKIIFDRHGKSTTAFTCDLWLIYYTISINSGKIFKNYNWLQSSDERPSSIYMYPAISNSASNLPIELVSLWRLNYIEIEFQPTDSYTTRSTRGISTSSNIQQEMCSTASINTYLFPPNHTTS